MCNIEAIDLIRFDDTEQQKKELDDQRQKLKKRRDELDAAIRAIDAKLAGRG